MDSQSRHTKSLIWGLFLISLGAAFLLDRLGILSVPSLGRLWPLFLIVIAAIRLAEGRVGSSVTFMLMGVWFLACEFDWYGLTYRNSWPLLLVAGGIGMVIRALTGEQSRRRTPTGGAS